MCLTAVVPFDRGALVASSHRVAKMPWGLVTGSGVVAGFEIASTECAGARGPGLEGVQAELGCLWRDLCGRLVGEEGGSTLAGADSIASEKPSWLFSYEDAKANGPIGLYRDFGDGPTATAWGWVLLSGPVAQGPTSDVKEVLREGELRLQWDLDRGADLDMRFEALRRAFAWFGSVWEWLDTDIEVGIHESGHHYSVDRVAVGEGE